MRRHKAMDVEKSNEFWVASKIGCPRAGVVPGVGGHLGTHIRTVNNDTSGCVVDARLSRGHL